mmetsp:Transcript_3516/g.13002  ORF Transcript_3516/g.13002 Transcript_3516/m.13002 type:complete len:208 (-) Transcript_3516:1121-1744(-)
MARVRGTRRRRHFQPNPTSLLGRGELSFQPTLVRPTSFATSARTPPGRRRAIYRPTAHPGSFRTRPSAKRVVRPNSPCRPSSRFQNSRRHRRRRDAKPRVRARPAAVPNRAAASTRDSTCWESSGFRNPCAPDQCPPLRCSGRKPCRRTTSSRCGVRGIRPHARRAERLGRFGLPRTSSGKYRPRRLTPSFDRHRRGRSCGCCFRRA